MAKPTKVTSYRSGNLVLRVASAFIYEVNLYKYYKDRVEVVDTKYFSASAPIKDKKDESSKLKDCTLVKCVTWVAAPLDYLIENNFIEDDGRTNTKSRTRK